MVSNVTQTYIHIIKKIIMIITSWCIIMLIKIKPYVGHVEYFMFQNFNKYK